MRLKHTVLHWATLNATPWCHRVWNRSCYLVNSWENVSRGKWHTKLNPTQCSSVTQARFIAFKIGDIKSQQSVCRRQQRCQWGVLWDFCELVLCLRPGDVFSWLLIVNKWTIVKQLLYTEESGVFCPFPHGKSLMSATVAHTDHMTMSSRPCLQFMRWNVAWHILKCTCTHTEMYPQLLNVEFLAPMITNSIVLNLTLCLS